MPPNPFKEFMSDRVTLVKRTGDRFEDLLASVQSGMILTQNPDIPIEDGDAFERKLPNGVVEQYEILDAGFYRAVAGMPSHYQSRVRKVTARERTPGRPAVVYNLIGTNSRVNLQSTDASINVVNVEQTALFDNMIEVIENFVSDPERASLLEESVNTMRSSVGTDSFVQSYRDFISLAADHISIFGPFLPALSQFLVA